jgi:Uma2 family endonuclease
MTAAPKRISIDEYLAMERRSQIKHEYFAGEIFAMAGASYVHTTIVGNVSRELGNSLRESDCNVLSSDQRVRTGSTLYTYPDVVLVCGKPEFDDQERDTLTNPVVIVEVLSRSTEGYDRGQKFLQYRSISSLREYVLVSQRQMLVEHYLRQPGGQWVLTTYNSPEHLVVFPTVNVSIPISNLYLKVELPATPSLRDEGTDTRVSSPS